MLDMKKLSSYELIKTEEITDVHSVGYLLKHKKSGARVMLLENDDDNKVFSIAFRTTPEDSTGVAHIMEHTVLCGSRKFPSKDPFVELIKGSMNTFLNAMTFPDKTMFPVASTNDRDFRNLCDVYLDAVFYPNIYKKEEIFRQEGWHYQMEDADSELEINGVVYNEMKGAMSSPEDVLSSKISSSLFPDNTYNNNSGGDPENIPDLTYEQYLDFHRTYYHPANSYIYLYGKLDFAEQLEWLDREYLSAFDDINIDTSIRPQKAFDSMVRLDASYPIASEEDEAQNTFLSWNAAIDVEQDIITASAIDILEMTLLALPGAPLREALLKAEIGLDISGSYESDLLQTVFSVTARGAEAEDAERFLEVVRNTLKEQVENGINPKALEAAINLNDFQFREADYGTYPRGLVYGIDVFETWLYDDEKPFDALKTTQAYDFLRTQIGTGYFEKLIEKYLLDNNHTSLVVLHPEKGLTARNEEAARNRLAEKKDSMQADEIRELIEKYNKLRDFQETPSTQEELEKIPSLAREDLSEEVRPLKNEVMTLGGVPVIWHEYETNGIAYLELMMDASGVAQEDLPYLYLLGSVLGMVDTKNYTYGELANEINSRTGGIGPTVAPLANSKDNSKARLCLSMNAKTLNEQVAFAFDMIEEILFTSRLDMEPRIREIVQRIKARLESGLSSSGSGTALIHGMAEFSAYYAIRDALNGVTGYRKIKTIEKDYDNKQDELHSKLRKILETIFADGRMLVSYTGSRENFGVLEEKLKHLRNMMADYKKSEDVVTDDPVSLLHYYPEITFSRENEGITTSGKVQYVARCGNFVNRGQKYTSVLAVLKTIMNYEYLWSNIRVKGGAYGCSVVFGRNGDTGFVSYRDPHLKATDKIYEGIPEFLENFTSSERDMTKYVIGTISDLDTPLNPAALGVRSMHAYLDGVTEEQMIRNRQAILKADQEDIRRLAPLIRAVLEDEVRCTLGSEEKLKEASDMFSRVEAL